MRFFRNTSLISLLISVAIASSFFIIPATGAPTIISQPFYFFFGLVCILALIQSFTSEAWRQMILKVGKQYGMLFCLLITGVVINVLFYAHENSGSPNPDFIGDFLRTVSLILLFLFILTQGRVAFSSLRYIIAAFFIPLCLTSLLFIRDLNPIMQASTIPLLAAYKLQGFQSDNPTALGAWLVITFSFCITLLLLDRNESLKKYLLGLASVASLALTWWTNSRGALIGALLIMLAVALIARIKQGQSLQKIILIPALIISVSLLILPPQARTSVFVRLYPQHYQLAINSDFKLPSSVVAGNVFDSLPQLTSAQNRGTLWADCPRYTLTHPFGEYGLNFSSIPTTCGQHNSLFQASFWGGWLTLGAILWLLFRLIQSAIQLFRRDSTDIYTVALSGALLGVLIQSFLNSFLQFKPLWIIAALLLAYHYEKISSKKEPAVYTVES